MTKPEDKLPFKDRRAATEFIRGCGVIMGNTGLESLAGSDRGPEYSIINGRALYLDADLLAWIRTEAEQRRGSSRRGRRRVGDPIKPVSSSEILRRSAVG